MSTYKNLIGKDVNFLTTDPDNAQAEGQIWYNSTSNVFKDLIVSEAWSSVGPLGTGRYAMSTGTGGTVDAGIAVFGRATTGATEEYNGSGWAVGGTGGTARYGGAKFGTQTAEVAAGGKASGTNLQNVEEYDGSSWSEVNNYPSTSRAYLSGFGILTAGVICGGVTASPDTWYSLTEEYDGTNWTTGGALNNARATAGTTGILTAGLVFGGYSPSLLAKTEEYNGTAWTESGDMSTARNHVAGSGTQDAALAYGGLTPSATTQTEAYNGSTWSTSPATLATATARNSSVGSAASTGLSFGGNPPGTTATEEYNRSINVITAAAWASGGSLNTGGRAGAAGSGTQTAAIIAGGGLGSVINNSEAYNGSSWTNLPTIGTARGYMAGATNAPSTASLVFGGATGPGGPYVNNSEEYSGSSWSEGSNLNTARGYLAGFGIQTAAVAAGGTAPNPSPPSRQNAAEEYNGSSWTSVTNVPAAANSWGGCGTETAGLVIGDVPMKGLLYDGSSWTSIPTLNTSGNYNKVFGTSSSAITAGRNPTPVAGTAVEEWNGTNWFTQASLATGRFNGLEAGTTTAGLVAGPPTATEEFTGETSALNIKTITTS